jgi:hypothetical protein
VSTALAYVAVDASWRPLYGYLAINEAGDLWQATLPAFTVGATVGPFDTPWPQPFDIAQIWPGRDYDRMRYVRMLVPSAPDEAATAIQAQNSATTLWFSNGMKGVPGFSPPDGNHLVQISFTEPDDLICDLGADGFYFSGTFAHTLLIRTATVEAEIVWNGALGVFQPV